MESKAPGRRRRGKRTCAVLALSVMTLIALPAQTPGALSFGGTDRAAGGNYVGTNRDGTQTLAGHVPLEVRNHTAVLKYHASLDIEARIILPLRNQPELAELLEDLYNPNSPKFHKFLTPDQFAQRFSADATDSMQAQEFLKSAGISLTGQSGNGTVLRVTGPSEAYEQAFGLRINYYRGKDGAMFFAPDADPVIPAALAGKVLAIGGLDDLPGLKSRLKVYPAAALPETATSGPPPGLPTPDQLKTAYNLNSIPADGSGQSMALVEFEGYSISDIEAYESAFGLPNVPLQTILLDGFSGAPGGLEATLDIEVMTAFAPGTTNVFVYEAFDSYNGWTDVWTQIAEDDKAKVVSCSYGDAEKTSPYTSFDTQNLPQMAAQGQAVFVASGDSGAFDAGGDTLAVDEPGSQPYVTDVGEDFLGFTHGRYGYETADIYGGGVSAIFPIPSYQETMASQAVPAALVSTTMRNVPDVVMYADTWIYYNSSWVELGGTSLSAPAWASFVSLVNQGLGKYAPIGFANPALYEIAHSGSYASDFHDITMGNNGYYPAEPGFDDATGLGSLNGLNLYNDLVGVTLALTQGASLRTLPNFGGAGTVVQILGKGLTRATSVTFNGQSAAFTVESPTMMSTSVPAGAATGYVTVTSPGGKLLSDVPFVVPVVALSTAGQVEPFAAESIVSWYGANLASGTITASGLPLPTQLDGTTVTVTDSTGTAFAAPLFYVSPTQINFEIPAGTALGTATVSVGGPGVGQSAAIQIANVSPGLFSLNGSGLVAAWVLPVVSGTQQPLQPVYQIVSGSVVPLPISLGPATEQVYLEMYGTGIRNASSVTAAVGGVGVPVLYSGAAPGFAGLDQVNIGPLPQSLAGAGSVGIVVMADTQAANTVNVTIQ